MSEAATNVARGLWLGVYLNDPDEFAPVDSWHRVRGLRAEVPAGVLAVDDGPYILADMAAAERDVIGTALGAVGLELADARMAELATVPVAGD